MTKEQAHEIMDKLDRCQNRIVDTHYCEWHSCKGCEFLVPSEQIEKAREVLANETN